MKVGELAIYVYNNPVITVFQALFLILKHLHALQ